MNEIEMILNAVEGINLGEERTLRSLWMMGEGLRLGIERETWSSIRTCVSTLESEHDLTVSKTYLGRASVLRSHFRTADAAVRAYNATFGLSTTSWIDSLNGGGKREPSAFDAAKTAKRYASLSRAQRKALAAAILAL